MTDSAISTTPGQLLYAKLNINLNEVPIEQLANYTAVEYYLTVEDEPPPDATNLEKVRGYLEAFHHLSNAKDWQKAKTIVSFQFDPTIHKELHLQLGTWGYYQEQSEIYNIFLDNLENLHPFYKITFLHEKGNIAYSKGHCLKAIDYYEQALEILNILPNEHQKGVILNNLGLAYLFLGNYDEATKYFWQRLIIAWKSQELEQEGATLNNLGLVHYAKKEYYKAIKYQKRSLSILRITGDKSGEGSALDSLGTNYAALAKYSEALGYQKQHLSITQELQDQRGEAEASCNVGITLILLEKYPEALESLQVSLKICKAIGTHSIEAYTLNHLAILYLILSERTLALEYCDRALSIATELNLPLAKECQELKEKLLSQEA